MSAMESNNQADSMQQEPEFTSHNTELDLVIAKMLRAGVLSSAAVILSGLLLFLVTGRSGYPGSSYPTEPGQIFRGLVLLRPYAVILTGLMLLILTPIMRVAASILVFLKERDYLYVGIASLVLVILIASIAMGL